MELKEAILLRHSVRKYTDRPIEPDKAAMLRSEAERINGETGLHIQLVLEEPKAFSTGIWKYGQFSGVKNYFVMAGGKGKENEKKTGYYGEHLVLLAQTLGLNTCWVGLTYRKIPGTFTLNDGETVHCVIALGYGVDGGRQHPLKPAGNFYEAEGGEPEGGVPGGGEPGGGGAEGGVPRWFLDGVEAALLAPTAVNQQKFKFILRDGNKVEAKTLSSMAGYTMVDLGIVKYHFELAAGKENFDWA